MGEPLDEALALLDGRAPEFAYGLSSHGPMAAEALVRLGRADQAVPWVKAYARRLEPVVATTAPLADGEWEGALGEPGRWGSWVGLFDRQLHAEPPAAVAARWVPRLAPGFMAGATHGPIRTAHALRSLGLCGEPGADTPERRRELAEALAYWAARYQELPGPPLLVGDRSVPDALLGLPVLPEEAPREALITTQVRHVDMVAAPFEQAVVALSAPGDPEAALVALAEGGAVAYLANAGTNPVALVHLVTAPMAAALLVRAVGAADRSTLLAYAWQAVAAMHVAYDRHRPPTGNGAPAPGADLPPGDTAREVLVAEAVASGDEHAIKLTEAALRAAAAGGGPALLAAAADANRRLR